MRTLLEMLREDGELQGRMYQTYRDYMTRKCHPEDVSDKLMSFAQWQAHLGIVPVHMQYIGSGITVDDRPETIEANRKEFGMGKPEILDD